MRAPVDHIPAPPFPVGLEWINSRPLRLDQLRGGPVLVEFWDFCRPNSIRTLPYLKAWNDRYGPHGLRVIGVHSWGFEPSSDPEAVAKAIEKLAIQYPVVIDSEHQIWRLYGNLGWPARYLFNGELLLEHYHYGEGGYDETELAIQELCSRQLPLLEPARPEDAAGARLVPQSEDVEGPYSGPYEAGGVWAVLDGTGIIQANGRVLRVDGPGCYELLSHDHSIAGTLELEISDGVRCHAVCFTPGLDPAG